MTRRVFHAERIARCDLRLLAFFAWWDAHGPFPITIDPTGGLRTDEAAQARLFAAGKSRAKTLAETAHGRGGAADAYPAVLDVGGRYVAGIHANTKEPSSRALFAQFGALAETHGLVWGGRWLKQFPPTPDNPTGGDQPHVEVVGWQDLPFPPELQE